jgi:hypothetical protein
MMEVTAETNVQGWYIENFFYQKRGASFLRHRHLEEDAECIMPVQGNIYPQYKMARSSSENNRRKCYFETFLKYLSHLGHYPDEPFQNNRGRVSLLNDCLFKRQRKHGL